jgi:hypothetical protein
LGGDAVVSAGAFYVLLHDLNAGGFTVLYRLMQLGNAGFVKHK